MMDIKKYIDNNKNEMYELLYELCRIPAPSGNEEKRAEYCKKWLTDRGCAGTYIDSANNVIFPYMCDGSDRITVIAAHTDTVFPDTEPMEYYEADGKAFCPGVGDDTASLSVMLMTAKYCVENSVKVDGGILFVANSCEEGLGNLKGTRQLFCDYGGRVEKFITFDSNINAICDVCVGSHRYDVEVRTEGGHSFRDFGNNNAIAVLSKIASAIYEIEVPKLENSHTTYNVGIISGGTSVNTIAENANMLCEYRSDNVECLKIMEEKFMKIFSSYTTDKVSVLVKRIGERPCADGLDPMREKALADFLVDIISPISGCEIRRESGSTDCNIPMSLGIPAVCIGVYYGGGAHTRGEWVKKDSLEMGLNIALKLVNSL